MHDGTFLPAGTLIVAATYPTHFDDENYASAAEFDPFRFSRMREAEGEGTKHQFVNTSVEYILFGHGKHAWYVDARVCAKVWESHMCDSPGRFFAAIELKAMLAYIVVNYDLQIPNEGPRPENIYFGANVIPNPSGKVMFRKRR